MFQTIYKLNKRNASKRLLLILVRTGGQGMDEIAAFLSHGVPAGVSIGTKHAMNDVYQVVSQL